MQRAEDRIENDRFIRFLFCFFFKFDAFFPVHDYKICTFCKECIKGTKKLTNYSFPSVLKYGTSMNELLYLCINILKIEKTAK